MVQVKFEIKYADNTKDVGELSLDEHTSNAPWIIAFDASPKAMSVNERKSIMDLLTASCSWLKVNNGLSAEIKMQY